MVSKNFVIAGIISAIVSTLLIKIFSPEINDFADKVRVSKPSKNIEIGSVG